MALPFDPADPHHSSPAQRLDEVAAVLSRAHVQYVNRLPKFALNLK
jgi:hypothetical protein